MHPSNAHSDSLNHKRSNFSFDSLKPKERPSLQKQEYSLQPLLYSDIIALLYSDKYMIGLADITQLSPGAINITQNNSYLLGMLQIVPISQHESRQQIEIGDRFYLKNVESNLYLCAQQELLKKFTNVGLKKQYSCHCQFTIQRPNNQNSTNTVFNRQPVRIRNVVSGLYLHIEQENSETATKYKHIWLSQMSDQFKVVVLNRSKHYPEFLNNNDIILLSYAISQKKYIGVAKKHNLYDVVDKESNSLNIQVNKDYYSLDCCYVQYYSQESGRRSIPCLWRVVRNTFDHNFTFLIRAKQDYVCLQHVQTGLFLQLDSNNIFTLKKTEASIKMQNLSKFKTQFSIANKFEPIYINHSVGVTFPIAQKKYYCQRVQGKKYLTLYISQYLCFFQNLIETMINPQIINESRESLVKQIKFYVFVYQQLQNNIEQFADKGFYFFQYTLKMLQLLKTILKDQKFDYQSTQFKLRRVLLCPLIIQIIKFISLIIIRNETFLKITSQDHKKTKEIIQIIFVLYHFHFEYTLNLMVSLASTDPNLVVKLLSQNIYKHHHFEQRVALISTINQIIDQYRRINFDQKNLKAILEKQHKLIINENCIYISFQRKEHSIFDLFESLEKYDSQNEAESSLCSEQKQRMRQRKQTFYFYYYLLSIIRILFNNKIDQLASSEHIITKSQYSIKDKMENNIKDSQFLPSLILKLSQEYHRNKNIKARIIIWELIYEFSSQIYRKEFITYNKLNFIVYDGTTLQSMTPLANILKVIPENTLEWIFSKQQLMQMLQEILDEQWESAYQLNVKLKLFSNIINFLIVVIITSTYDLYTLNQIQKFGINLSRIYDRNSRGNKTQNASKFFVKTQQEINEYNKKITFVIVDGVKMYLDNLMIKLTSFFQAIFIQKKRLYIYPMYSHRHLLFQFPYFKQKYTELSINKRIRNSIKSIEHLLQLNEESLQESGLVLSREELQVGLNEDRDDAHSKGVKLIQKIIEDLDCLAIIMESFRLYGQDKYLKENMVASMTLKIMNIQGLLKAVYKNKIYYKYSDAFNLSSHLFQFIIQNSFEQDLILPLLQSLEDRIMSNYNIFVLIKENIDQFFNLLVDSATYKTSKIILKWVAKQIENMPAPIHIKEYQFLYVEAMKLIEAEANINLLFLINILKQIGLHHPQMEEVIYSKLISHPQIQSFFIGDCSSLLSIKIASDKLYKDHHLFYLQYQASLQAVTIFRICSTYPHLMSHLSNLLPYQQIRQIMQKHQQYFLFRPLLTYIVNQLNSQRQIQVIEFCVISICEHLSQYKNYLRELDNYRVRYSLLRDKQGKAQTHLCRSNSVALTHPKSIVDEAFSNQKQFYWEYLYWIPFYNKGEGLLVKLQQIIKLYIHKDCRFQNIIDHNLELISISLQEIKAMISKSDQNKEFVRQIKNILNLIKIIKNRQKARNKKTKNDQQIQQIYKTLQDSDLMKPFLSKLIPSLIKSSTFPRVASLSQYPSGYELQINTVALQIQSSIVESQNMSNQDRSKHSLITPEQNESRYLVEQQYFDLLQFITRLKQITQYKVRLYDKLLHILLQYFEKGGSLVMLQYKLKQQVVAHTNLMVEYKQTEYKIERQVVKSIPKDAFSKKTNTTAVSFGLYAIDINKFKDLIQNNQLQLLCIIFKQIISKINEGHLLDQHQPNSNSFGQMQQLLLQLFRLISRDQYKVTQIVQACHLFTNIMIKCQRHQEHTFANLNQLYSSISLFIFQVVNSHGNQLNHRLYHQIMMLFGTIQFKYLKSFNKLLEEFVIKSIRPKMPTNLYYYSMHQIIKMNIDMVANCNRRVSIEAFSMSLQFISQQLHNMIEGDYFSENMEFYQNHKLIVSILDLLQLILTHSTLPTNYQFPNAIIITLIDYQHLIYSNIFQQLSLIDNKSRLQLYQSLVVQILSFFHVFSLLKCGKLEPNSLLAQRHLFLRELKLNSKEVYEYYQQHFDFCLLRNTDSILVIQSFPKERQLMAWKTEFYKMLSSNNDLNNKKDNIFSYAILAVQQEKEELKYENCCHRIQPKVIIASTFTLLLATLQRFIANKPQEPNLCFSLLMIINLVLLVFVIVQRIMMIRKLVRLQIETYVFESWYSFVLNNKIFIVCALTLLLININSLVSPTLFSFLFFIHIFSNNNINSITSSSIGFNIKLLTSLALLSFATMFIFAIVINSQQNSSTIPIYNIETKYNVNFMILLLRVWSNQFLYSASFYYFLVIFLSLIYVFMASIIYFFLSSAQLQKQRSKSCLLCDKQQSQQMEKYHSHAKDHHIKYEHNLMRYISVFKYILRKEELSLQEQQIKLMILEKDRNIFK